MALLISITSGLQYDQVTVFVIGYDGLVSFWWYLGKRKNSLSGDYIVAAQNSVSSINHLLYVVEA